MKLVCKYSNDFEHFNIIKNNIYEIIKISDIYYEIIVNNHKYALHNSYITEFYTLEESRILKIKQLYDKSL